MKYEPETDPNINDTSQALYLGLSGPIADASWTHNVSHVNVNKQQFY